VLDWIIVCGNLGWPPNKRRILAKAYAAAVSDRPVIPATAYSMAGSGKKPADVAADAESKSVAESKARLLQLPADLQEVFSLPRYVAPASARSGDAHGTSRALLAARCSLLFTEAGMIAAESVVGCQRGQGARQGGAQSGEGRQGCFGQGQGGSETRCEEGSSRCCGGGASGRSRRRRRRGGSSPSAARSKGRAGEAEALRRWQGREGRFLL
jgi:hypothetical protein